EIIIKNSSQHQRPLSTLLERYRRDILPRKAQNTQNAQNKQLDRLQQAFGHIHAPALRPCDIAKYHDQVGASAPYQANRELALFTHVCKYGVRWGYFDDNPCREIQRFPEHPRDRYITNLEFVSVRACAPPWVQIVMDLAYLTGQRRIDLLALQRRHLTEDGLLIQQTKTGTKLLIEWTPDLRATIRRALAELPPAGIEPLFIICDPHGQQRRDNAFCMAWKRLMRH